MTRDKITIERTFDALIDDVWDLWTTADGIESWWGPEGFTTKVHEIDVRPGGSLAFTMTAANPEIVAYLQRERIPVATDARLRYTEVVARRRLGWLQKMDFIDGVEPYDVAGVVEIAGVPDGVQMTIRLDALHAPIWTERAVAGWESQLGRLARVLADRKSA